MLDICNQVLEKMVLGIELIVNRKSQARLKNILGIFLLLISVFGVYFVLADEPEPENLVRDYDGKMVDANSPYVWKRTSSTEIFKNPDGTYTRTIGQGTKYIDDKSRRFPFYSEFKETFFNLINSTDPLFDYELNQYYEPGWNVYFKENPTQGQVVKYIVNNTEITFQPMALNFRNDLSQIQQIQMIDNVVGVPDINKFVYPNAYGSGINLTYENKLGVMKENLIIESFNDLPSPAQYIIDGGNATLDLDFIISTNSKMMINGVEWDKRNTASSSSNVEIQNQEGETLYNLPTPIITDSAGNSTIGKYEFKKSGSSLYVILKTPYGFLENAVYPVYVDPTITLDSTYVNDDAYTDSSIPDFNYNSAALNLQEPDSVRAYIEFNITDVLPVGMIIQNAYLFLTGSGVSGSSNVSVYNVYEDIDETLITWNNQPCGTGFDNATACNTTSETTWVTSTFPSVLHNFSITNMLSSQINQSNVFLGIALRTDNSGSDDIGFKSSENPTVEDRPFINLTYIPSINIISPTPAQTFTEDAPTAELNVSIVVAMDTCYWTNDSGVTNYTMSSVNTTYFYNNTAGSLLLDGSHTVEFYCNESSDGTWRTSDSVTFDVDSVNVTVCRDLTVSRTYELQNDIDAIGDCIGVTISDLIFNGNSYYIKGESILVGTGFDTANDVENITIKNTNITNFVVGIDGRYHNSFIENNSFFGIQRALYFNGYSEKNIFSNNTFKNITSRSILFFLGGSGNSFLNNFIDTDGGDILIETRIGTNNMSNSIFRDNNFTNITIDVVYVDGPGSPSWSINNTFINTTYGVEDLSLHFQSSLTRKWYFSPQVNFTHNGTAVSGANVTAFNITGGVQNSELTDGNGQTSQWELIEYINTGGTKTYYTNYTFNVTYPNWDTDSQSINLTTNYLDQQFNISDGTPPVTTILMTSPPSGASYTNDTWTNQNIKSTMITTDAAGFDDTLYPAYCTDTTNTCAPDTFISSGVTVSTEGTSYIRYNSTDYAGNVEATQTRTLKIDTTPPNITIIIPTNNTNSSDTTLDINFTVTDTGSGIDSCWYSNGTLTSNITLSSCTNITTAVWAEGQHSITIWVNDSVNNVNSTGVTFTIDTTLPVLIITSPLNQSYSTDATDLKYTFTEINCESAWYSLDNGTTNSSASACSTNWTGLTSIEGSNRWTVYLNDSANNQNSTSVTFHKDTVYPQISISIPTNYTNSSDTTLDINYTATDLNIDSCWWTNDTGANNNSLTNCNINITDAVWADSTITVRVYVNDTVNNVNWTSVIFTIDSTNPVANLTYPLNNTYNSSLIQNFTFNVSDNLGVSNSTLYIWNTTGEYNSTNSTFASNVLEDTVGIVHTLVEGVYNWWVKVWDWAGNTFTTGNQTIIIDTTKPNISFESSTDANATYKQTGDVLINVSVADTNLDSVQFSWNDINETFANSGDGYYWENKTGLSEGSYNFYAWINDSANNYNETATRTIYIDLNNPLISLVHPTPSSYNYNTSISLNYTVSDTYLDTCWYNLDGATTNTTLTNCANLTNGFNTSESSHTLFLYANDSSGRIGADSVSFSVSLAPPSIILNYPTDDSWLNYKLNVDFNFTPTDAGGIDTCEIWGNWTGTWHKNTTLLAPSTGVINSTTLNLTDGTGYSWNVWCNDTGNNAVWGNPTSNNTFSIDSIYPLISYGDITAGDFANLSQSSIYVNLSLTELNLKLINFTLKNDTAIVNSTSFSVATYVINWTNLVDANYSYYVNITDDADNVNSTEIRYITLDDTLPVANLIYPTNNTHNATLTQNITYNASDNLGISNSTLYIWNTTGEYNSTSTTFASNVLEDTVGIVVTFAEGIYYWWVQVWDWADNTFITGNQTFTIDTTFPVIDYNGGTQDDETNTTSTEIYINVSVTEDHEEIIVFRIHNSTGSYNTTSYSDFTRNINLTNVRDGTYTYNVTINDSSGQTSNTSTRTIRLDDTKPVLTINNPLAQNYGTNNSMYLNYSATDNVVGLDECWYYILNSTLSIAKSTETLSTCQNDSFSLPEGDIDYTLYLFAKDLLAQTQSTTVTFGIRTISPIIILTTANDTHSNNETVGNYFNFTVETNADSISNCSLYGNWTTGWHLNETITSPSESTDTNFEPVNLSEGNYYWNIECTDNLDNSGFALNNNTYIVDLTDPVINITTITPQTGSQTFNFNTTVTDTYLSTTTCKYSIFNSSGGIPGVENISTICNAQVAGTTFAFDTYNLTVYATDKAGNENSSTKQFTTTQVTGGVSGGGGLPETIIEIQEVFIEQPGVCGNLLCEPEVGENFWNCADCGGLNIDDLLLSCFSEIESENQKCITKQAPVLFYIAMLLIIVVAIAMVVRIPAIRKRLPQQIIREIPKEKQKKVKKGLGLASSWLKNQQSFIRRWRKR